MAKQAGPHSAVSKLMCSAAFLVSYDKCWSDYCAQVIYTDTHTPHLNLPLQPPLPAASVQARGGGKGGNSGPGAVRGGGAGRPKAGVLCVETIDCGDGGVN